MNVMIQDEIIKKMDSFLLQTIEKKLVSPVYALNGDVWREKKEVLEKLYRSLYNPKSPDTAILGEKGLGKSLLTKLLAMLNETSNPQQVPIAVYSLNINAIKRFPNYKKFIYQVVKAFEKVQGLIQQSNKHARVVLYLDGIAMIDFEGEEVDSLLRDTLLTSKVAIVGDMERSKYEVSLFKERYFWMKWNVVELKTVISNPDEIVKQSSALLKGFFEDRTLTPIVRRAGVNWKSRERELKQLSDFVLMPENPITAILGVAGSGKTTLLEMLSGLSNNPEAQKNPLFQGINQFFVYSLKLSAIQKLDNYQEYINRIIDEFAVAEKALQLFDKKARIILFIDELHQLTFSMKTGSRTGGDALKEKLTTSPVAVIGATTRIEFDHAFSNDQAFRERWNIMELPQLTKELIVNVLRERWKVFVKKVWEKRGYDVQDIPAIPELSDRVIDELLLRNAMYRPEMGEPRKSLRILEGLAVSWLDSGKTPDVKDVLMIFNKWFGIDVEFDVMSINKNVNRRLKGQINAKRELMQALYYAKLQSQTTPFRPVMKLMFAGSTGVGKTECVKAIAEVYGKSRDAFKQFNMPDFAGEKGEEEFRQLLGEYAEHNPNGIILLDEGEKAKNVFNALLAILEEGVVNYIIEDSGNFIYREISLRNNIIVMTTNAGAQSLREKAKFEDKAVRSTLQDDEETEMFDRSSTASRGKDLKTELLNSGFTPELYNRFDRVILFENLDNKTLLEIGDSVIEGIIQTVERSFGVETVMAEEKRMWRDFGVDSYDISAQILLTRMNDTDTDMGGARGMIKQVGNLISDYLIPFIFEKGLAYTGSTVQMGVGRDSRLYIDNVDEYKNEIVIKILKEA